MKRPLRLLVIGGVAAGTKAASKARRDDPSMKITIITQEKYISYAGCGLAYYVGGVVDNRSKLFARSPETFGGKYNIDVLLRHRAERISVYDKTVNVTDLESGESLSMEYDKLLIATGASAVIPPIDGIDSQGVFTLHSIDDADSVKNYLNSRGVKNACIVGGGYIGVEIAENLTGLGISCDMFEGEDRILPGFFDPDMSEQIGKHLISKGVIIHAGCLVEKINHDSSGQVVSVISGGREHECRLAIIAAGVRPNVELAKEARIAIGATGAIKVDSRMETSSRGIFAAGDCAESIDLVSGNPCWYPLGSTANKQGRIAGANIAGGKKVFKGVLGTSIVKVFDIAAARTGLSEQKALEYGFNPVSVSFTGSAHAGYYPGKSEITLKLIADSVSKKLLGAQAFGDESVDKAIDTIAAALAGKISIPDLANLDISYSPPYSTALGTVVITAGILENKLRM
ncbi:FAD-dependent oxidoreductase [Candidatus Latescibacterota bacterium]